MQRGPWAGIGGTSLDKLIVHATLCSFVHPPKGGDELNKGLSIVGRIGEQVINPCFIGLKVVLFTQMALREQELSKKA